MGFARAICEDLLTCESAPNSFSGNCSKIGSRTLATPPENRKGEPPLNAAMTRCPSPTRFINSKLIDGMLSDWSIPGEHAAAAAYDVARTVCRRAERCMVRLIDAGEIVDANVLPYLNRLSDLLWLFGRKLELDAGVSGSLRDANAKTGPRWSRAW